MSQWTHIDVAIRIDGIPALGSEHPDFGNTVKYSDDEEAWDKCNVPCGSEGSLQYNVIEYGDGLPWLAIQIWGDLRNYEDVDEIIDYLNRCCDGHSVRSGIGEIDVEYKPKIVVQYCGAKLEGKWKIVHKELPETEDGVEVGPDDIVYYTVAGGEALSTSWKEWKWLGMGKCYSTQKALEEANG